MGGASPRVSAMSVANNCVFGVVLSGSGGVIDNSQVAGSGLDGVILLGAINATVHSNHLSGSGRFGVILGSASNSNVIRDNLFTGNGDIEGGAIGVLFGSSNQFLRNLITENLDGVSVQDSGNLVDGNTVNDNLRVGVAVDGANNVVQNNNATGNGAVDLSEAAAGCGTTTWQNNIFVTDSVAGVSDGGPGAGCIRGSAPTPPVLNLVAGTGGAVPGGTGFFTVFPQSPAVSTTISSFLGLGSAGTQGVYSCDRATPTDPCLPIADLNKLIPGGAGNFTSFIGTGAGQEGVYSCDRATPTDPCLPIADLGKLIPGGTGMFTAFSDLSLALGPVDPIRVGFIGSGAGQQGIYVAPFDATHPPNPIKVADLTTAIPGGVGTFTAFSDLSLTLGPVDPIRVGFVGSGAGQQGVYMAAFDATHPPNPVKVADLTTAMPGGAGNFTGFTSVSTSLGHTAFLGQGNFGQAGIYVASTLKKVVAVGDTLMGKVVAGLRLGRDGLDGNRLGFTATFIDGSEGVFVAEVNFFNYDFTGFFRPVENQPVVNQVKANQAVPVKFSLGGNHGLEIFAPGYPKSVPVSCNSSAPLGVVEETVTAGGSSLSYSAGADQYNYVWKTNQAWAGSCRQLILGLMDGRFHAATFTFK